jgi:hypothetical protein
MRTANSSTGQTTRSLMLEELRMLKDNKLESGVTTEVNTNNGQLSILIKQRVHKLRESTKNLDSMWTDHSILFQSFHSTELLSATVPTTFGWEDGELTLKPNNGTSMESPRLSRITTGNHTHLISNQTVDQPMSDALLPTQDGGKCGDLKEDILSTIRVRY